MIKRFNLTDEKWLPCLLRDGRRETRSLRDVLQNADDVRELYSQSPLITMGMYRLLLAILYAVYQPYRRRDWLTIRDADAFDKVSAYLDELHDRFYLHHPTRPFFQTTQEIGKPQTLAGLYVERARGNNATLFDHSRDVEMPVLDAATAARALLAGQYYALGGGNSGIKGKNFTDATLTRGAAFLAQGETLFETLLFNLVPFEQLPNNFAKRRKFADENEDRPIWERDDPFDVDRSVPDGIMDYLTWQSRRLKLVPNEAGQVVAMFRSQGQSLDSSVTRDPHKFYRQTKKGGLTPLTFNKNKALWRNSETLFRIRDTSVEPPISFMWLDVLRNRKELSQDKALQCLAFGMSTDRPPQAATVFFIRSQQLPLPLGVFADDDESKLLRLLTEALSISERVADALWESAKAIAVVLYANPKELRDEKTGEYLPIWKVNGWKKPTPEIKSWVNSLQLTTIYWEQLGAYFNSYLAEFTDVERAEAAQVQWMGWVRESAEFAFKTLSDQPSDQTLHTRHAYIIGRGWLRSKLNQHVPKENSDEQQTG